MVTLHFRNAVLFTLFLRTESEPNTVLAVRTSGKRRPWATEQASKLVKGG